MERDVMDRLVACKNSPSRKHLLLQVARQVGKTWAARVLARTVFGQMAYVDCMVDESMRVVFEGSLDPHRLLDAIASW